MSDDFDTLQPIFDLVGGEHDIDQASRVLARAVREYRAPAVGAFQISCSDESEKENVQHFHREFVQELLPEFKFWKRSSFRTANLGARYEPGAAAIAEDHYAIPQSDSAHKLLMIKVSSHVSVLGEGNDTVYGRMERYKKESVYCGALDLLLAGGRGLPFLEELAQVFQADGVDRLGYLRDPQRVDPSRRALVAAVTNTTLQSKRVREECVALEQHTPTVFVILACVTINRLGDDSELICGVDIVDRRDETPRAMYRGVGIDPRAYNLDIVRGRARLVPG